MNASAIDLKLPLCVDFFSTSSITPVRRTVPLQTFQAISIKDATSAGTRLHPVGNAGVFIYTVHRFNSRPACLLALST